MNELDHASELLRFARIRATKARQSLYLQQEKVERTASERDAAERRVNELLAKAAQGVAA
jgi:hypothetical protein